MNDENGYFNRRSFLGLSLASTAPFFLGHTVDVFARDGEAVRSDDVLVVIQLSGGNDGLSTVVPHADDEYHKLRRSIRVAEPLKIDDRVGLHPNLDKLAGLFKEGKLAIVQGCSYPNPNRSHFKAMDIWHSGTLRGRGTPTGWLGRAIDSCCPKTENPNLVVNLGKSVPYALAARLNKPVAFESPEAFQWKGDWRDTIYFDHMNQKEEGIDDRTWLHRVAADARASSTKLRKAARGYRPKVAYPRFRLANDLRTVASLIEGGVGTRVYYVSMGGFDTHSGQRRRHDQLMRQFGDSVTAFYRDLAARGSSKRVLMMVFSEFGRRVAENGSQGTDHGVAGPMFLIGDRVKGGVHGAHPSLTDLDRGDLKMACDFRSVYASVLDEWIKVDSEKVLGSKFEKFKVLT